MREAVRRLLLDRRQAQRGSVLSGVLIMVAFLAIISGALATELSTNFLLSRNAADRVVSEATVNSAMELVLSQLQDTQTTPLFNGCPSIGSLALNGSTAVPAFASCYPVIDSESPQQLDGVASGTGHFLSDPTHAFVPGAVNAFLDGDTKGNLVAIRNGSTVPGWSVPLGGEIVGAPQAMPDVNTPNGVSYLAPVTNPSNGAANGCSTNCVALLSGSGSGQPAFTCLMKASGPVTSQPAAGLAFPADAYFGDQSGDLLAYSALSGQSGSCDQEDAESISTDVGASSQVVAGPFVIKASGKKPVDEVYVIVAAGSQGYLVHYTYSLVSGGQAGFSFAGKMQLPGVGSGAAFQVSTPTMPNPTIAIAFTNGEVGLVQVQPGYSTTLLSTRMLPAAIADAPFWSASGQLGVAAGSTLYVLDSNLNVLSSFAAPASIATTPAADAGGDWFVGTSSGYLYEVQRVGTSAQMVQTASYGGAGDLTSSPLALPCSIGICVYTASSDGSIYFAGLDARDAIVDSCLGPCGSSSFGLRAVVEVGSAASPRTVHVQGWSYYSP